MISKINRCLIILSALICASTHVHSQEVVAIVSGEPITDRDIIQYTRRIPTMRAYLGMPGGPMLLLNDMVQERLLLLEGERLGIERQGRDNVTYIYEVLRQLSKPCPLLSDKKDIRAFYDAHPEYFATALYLRLRRIGLRVSEQTETAVGVQLMQLRERIANGEITFAQAASQYSEDSASKDRNGEIGFIPLDPDNSVLTQLSQAKIDDIIGPLREQELTFLYQVMDRREPIVEPFESAQAQIPKVQQDICRKAMLGALFGELSQRWSVEIKVDDISIWPE